MALSVGLAGLAAWQLAQTRDIALPPVTGRPALMASTESTPDFGETSIPERLRAAKIFGTESRPAATGGAAPALLAGSIMVRGRGVALLQVEGGQIIRLAPGGIWRGLRLDRLTPDSAVFRSGERTFAVAFGSAVQP